ncbi:isopentenyl phosphate kinase [Halosegnis longus]|uniref:isopentenyl phosphate kinase n=1 Tax=Halosegnis longus TaxID=2216012 RepID=UPI000A6CD772|nr:MULTISPECIES: isopentenyl phosphate kinase [Halobacteriales]
MSSPTILKLGGSVVTDKDEPETVATESLARLAADIAAFDDPLVVVHGGGSFGHHHASRHGISRTDGSRDAQAARDITNAMRTLNDAVVAALADAGVPAVPVHPLSVAARDTDGDLTLPTASVETMLDSGFVPVLHGDVVAHAGEGVTILSGDELVVSLAESLGAERVGLCSAVPGVLDNEENVIPTIEAFDDVAHVLGGSESTDVTGGMAAKVRELLALDSPAYIFDAAGVGPFLAGERPGTRIG